MASEQLVEYIKKSRSESKSDDTIRSNLHAVGWGSDAVNRAFLIVDSPDIPVPAPSEVPAPENKPKLTLNHSMWDAFEHILLFISLYVFAFAVSFLLHSYIDHFWPEIKNTSGYYSSYSGGLILSSMAALIVSFPLFAAFFLHLGFRTRNHPELRNLRSRKFLIYLTLIITFIIMIAYVIAAVYGFLTGNISVNFSLHFGAILLVCGSIFGYYLNQIKEDRTLNV